MVLRVQFALLLSVFSVAQLQFVFSQDVPIIDCTNLCSKDCAICVQGPSIAYPSCSCHKYDDEHPCVKHLFYGGEVGCSTRVTCNTSNGVCGGTCYGVDGNGRCTECKSRYYGKDCDNEVQCDLELGTCDKDKCFGIAGDGTCSSCKPNRQGPLCKTQCSQKGGVCDASCQNDENAGCTRCKPNFFTNDCSKDRKSDGCSLAQGICDPETCEGIFGDGNCTSCLPGFYGKHCKDAVSAHCAVCDSNGCSGVSGNGTCNKCPEGRYTTNCSQVSECVNDPESGRGGICNEGTCWGPGVEESVCDACLEGWAGRYCDKRIQCEPNNGSCESGTCSGVSGNGECTECYDGYFGPYCTEEETCVLENAIGEIDLSTGSCSACKPGFRGVDCDQKVTCSSAPGGICLEDSCYGLRGDGHCTRCSTGFFGIDCQHKATCNLERGTCNCSREGDGKCSSCNPGFEGENCEIRITPPSVEETVVVVSNREIAMSVGIGGALAIASVALLGRLVGKPSHEDYEQDFMKIEKQSTFVKSNPSFVSESDIVISSKEKWDAAFVATN